MQRNAGRTLALAVTLLTMGATASAASATSLGPPPWNGALCPAVGFDTGCEYAIDVTAVDPISGAATAVTISRDATQGPYDGIEDAMVVVQNDDPTNTLKTLTLGVVGSGNEMFDFDGDGLCNPDGGGNASRGVPNDPPAGCPFGPTGYEGPDNTFTGIVSPGPQGTVSFTTPLAPGQNTYFSLELGPSFSPTLGGVNDWVTSTQAAAGQTPASNVAVPTGTNVTDTAVVNGPHGAPQPPGAVPGNGAARGTAVYALFDNSSCSGTPVYTSPSEPVTGGVAAPSDPVGAALASGRYYWLVNYSGDTTNTPTTSLCGDETLDIGSTTVTTTLSATTVTSGTGVTDTAVITGVGPAGAATGSATFTVFSDPACTTQLGASETDAVTNGMVTSSSRMLPIGGPYYYVVSYSGDSANASGTSPCGSETVVVQPTPATPVTPVTPKTPVTSGTTNNTITLIGKPRINRSTGVIRQKARVYNSGSLGWRLTYKRCMAGKVKPGHKCLTKTVGYGHGHASIASGFFTIKVTAGKAVIKALKQGKTLTVAASFTFQSTLGGTAGHRSAKIVVKGRKPKHHKTH